MRPFVLQYIPSRDQLLDLAVGWLVWMKGNELMKQIGGHPQRGLAMSYQ